MPPKGKQPPETFAEVGTSGLKRSAGYVQEEFLTELSGARWKRALKQMVTNDPVIVAFTRCIEMLVRQASWDWKPASEDGEDERVKDFVAGAWKDMSSSWQDTLSEIVTFIPWGFQYSEIVYKRRSGMSPGQVGTAALPASKFDDGLIGWRKWAGRAQETIERWEFDENGGAQAAVQVAPPDYQTRTIPIDKALLFRTTANKGNPEGASYCRGAYTSWYYKTNIQRVEAIGIERDLAGYPVVKIPSSVIDAGGNNLESYKSLARDTRRDEQEGAVIPSDCYPNTSVPMYELKLLSTGGTRAIDTDKVINRFDQRILMSVMADFLLLGHEKVGSFALSSSKTNLFSVALGAQMDTICDVVNRHAVPRLLKLNGFPAQSAPTLYHGDVETPDLGEIGEFVAKLSGANIVFTDEEAAWVKKQAGFPVLEDGKAVRKPTTVRQPQPEPVGERGQLRAAAEAAGAVPSEDEIEETVAWFDMAAPEDAQGALDAELVEG